jgi:hypothetical protein
LKSRGWWRGLTLRSYFHRCRACRTALAPLARIISGGKAASGPYGNFGQKGTFPDSRKPRPGTHFTRQAIALKPDQLWVSLKLEILRALSSVCAQHGEALS